MDVCADVLLSESIWNLGLLDHLVKRADIVAPYLRDDKLTGIQIGAGQILARLYDKPLEIKTKSHKDWMYLVWQVESVAEDHRIIRVEFQLRREAIKDLGIEAFQDLMPRLDNLWAYSTREWLKVQDDPKKHHTQQTTLPWWRVVQAGAGKAIEAHPLTFAIPTIGPILESPAYLGQCVYNRRTLSKWHRYSSGSSVERMDEGIERRPQSDWITVDNAWPALVERDIWDQVQARRKQSRQQHVHVSGRAIHADYLLVGLMTCGVCGGRMMGHTTVNRKGCRNRYYACGRHHAGHKDLCPKRYTVPADLVEQHILGIVRADLERLRDDDQLHLYVADELRRITGGQSDTREQLQRRLAGLDQQLARLREHVLAVDPDTANALGSV